MTRVVVVVAIISVAGVWLYWMGGKNARQSNREIKIEREKEIGDAINNCAGSHWTGRLRGCE